MKARAIGYTGARTSDVPTEIHENQNWVGQCPNGHLSSRVRAPKVGRVTSCGKCSRRYNPAYAITWTRGEVFRAARRTAARIAAQEQS
jgi:hypothetical protein